MVEARTESPIWSGTWKRRCLPRIARAGESLLQRPAISDSVRTALSHAMSTDVNATVRATLWEALGRRGRMHQRRLDDADAIADEIARCARSCTPLDLEALSILRRLTVADVLAEHNLERRRRAAYRLAWDFGMAKTVPQACSTTQPTAS
jgi:hypothetical protein